MISLVEIYDIFIYIYYDYFPVCVECIGLSVWWEAEVTKAVVI